MSEVRVSEWLWLEGTSKMTWSNPCMAPSRDSWRRLLKTRCSQVCMALQMRFRHLSGQTVPVFHYPHSKNVFSYVQMGFHISVCAHHLLSPLWAPLTRVCLQLLHSLRSGICTFICIPPEPAFLQAQLAQPLLIGRMLQALNHSVALHQTRTSVCIQPVSKQCEWEGS